MSDREKSEPFSMPASDIVDAFRPTIRAPKKSDEAARAIAETDQQTGAAREFARMAAAFFLEVIRAGVPQGEAISLSGDYIRAVLQDRALRDSVRERTERGPLDK